MLIVFAWMWHVNDTDSRRPGMARPAWATGIHLAGAKLNFYICRQIKRRVGKLVAAAQWASVSDPSHGARIQHAPPPLDALSDC